MNELKPAGASEKTNKRAARSNRQESPDHDRGVSRREYLPELDGLRFCAFAVVFLHHALPHDPSLYTAVGLSVTAASWLVSSLQAGGFGVDLFFALSSYLITRLLLKELEQFGSLDLKRFYLRRTLRIWPLYFFFLITASLVVPLLLPKEELSAPYLIGYSLFSGNWIVGALGYPSSVAAPLWSVSIEEQFYLVWPLAVGWAGKAKIRNVAIAMLGISAATRLILWQLDVPHPGVWTNTFARLDPIALGALVATSRRMPVAVWASPLVMVVLGLASWVFSSRYLSLDGPGALLLYPLVGAGSAMCVAAALNSSGSIAKVLSLPVLAFLGKISYGLYVFHVLAIQLADRVEWLSGSAAGYAAKVLIAFGLTILIAALSYQFLEKPFLLLKSRFTRVQSRPV